MKNHINRRTFLKIGALASTSLYSKNVLAEISYFSDAKATNNKNFYNFKLGKFNCACLHDGDVDYKPKSFFSNVPVEQIEKTLSQYNLPTDHITTPYTYLFVNTGNHRVLVDMGAGHLTDTTGNLVQNMKLAGITPSEIDTVFITHAHPDHIGGTLDNQGKPNYPNAHYFIWKDEWEFWFSDKAFETTSEFFIKTAREQLGPIKDRVTLVDQESEILQGVRVLSAPGHTPGHMVVSFSSGDEHLFYIGDAVLHPIHLEHPDWLPVFDILPDKAAVSKRRIFDLVADKKAWVIGQHFPPFPNLGHVVKTENGWKWQPVEIEE